MIRLKGLICLGMCIMSTFTYAQTSKDEIKKIANVNQLMKERYSLLDTEQEIWLKNYKIRQEKATRYIGNFTLTAYCNCSACCGKWSGGACFNGEYPKKNWTIAVDPKIIPINSIVEIEGIGTFKAQDTGSAIKGHKIDIYFESHQKALEFGKKHGIKVYKAKTDTP